MKEDCSRRGFDTATKRHEETQKVGEPGFTTKSTEGIEHLNQCRWSAFVSADLPVSIVIANQNNLG